MISDIQQSHNAVEHIISDISMASESQSHCDQTWECLSVALDECCDTQDKPYSLV